jgi:hypothetical protein
VSFKVVRVSDFRQFAALPSARRYPQFNRSPNFTLGIIIFGFYGRADLPARPQAPR